MDHAPPRRYKNTSEAAYRHLLQTLSHTPAPGSWNYGLLEILKMDTIEISISFYHNSDESQTFFRIGPNPFSPLRKCIRKSDCTERGPITLEAHNAQQATC